MVMTYAKGPTMTCRVIPMSKQLKKHGLEFQIFALSEHFRGGEETTRIDGEPVHVIGQAHFTTGPNGEKIRFGGLRYLQEVWKTFCRFTKRLRREHPDIVHVFTTDPGALFIAMGLRLQGFRVILDVDDSTYGMGVMAGYPKPILWIQWLLENSIPRTFRFLSGATFSRARQYRGLTRLQIPVTTNGYQRNWAAGSQPLIRVIMVGNMAAIHLHMKVVEIIPKIIHRNDRIRFCFIGTGERFPAVQRRAKELGLTDALELTGYLPREQVIRKMCEADIGICPMENNPFDRSRLPMKILEYMAAGLCVVSAPIGDIPNVIQHRKNGWLYRPGDMNDFAEGIVQLASEPDLIGRLAKQALEDVRQYDPSKIEKAWLHFYRKAGGWIQK
ncbi:MAG: glycosyltransferase family 4 protein [Candidatus Omnitrophica bacterium]|nr:glycosyltransferase family 4 protein [Candidatus Omnitrophota bacterium]